MATLLSGNTIISDEEKQEYVALYAKGVDKEKIYELYVDRHGKTFRSAESFSRTVRGWRRMSKVGSAILEAANIDGGFVPHGCTAQVNANGEVTQVWVKQHRDDNDWRELIEHIKESVLDSPKPFEATSSVAREYDLSMLEIPLYDMHFGIADFAYYENTLNDLLSVIKSGAYDEINVVIGQDLLHNDDFEGRTTKGTPIEKVDMVQAWEDAKRFWYAVIDTAVEYAWKVKIIYSKGNHDKSMSWAFVQMLKAFYGDKIEVDDTLVSRKVIHWHGCFIGVTHGEYKKSKANELFQQFVCEFPQEFASSKVREVHAGHEHAEGDKDVGAMVRRLSTSAKTDEWSLDNGFTGAHKRFMLFEYKPNRLSAVYYI